MHLGSNLRSGVSPSYLLHDTYGVAQDAITEESNRGPLGRGAASLDEFVESALRLQLTNPLLGQTADAPTQSSGGWRWQVVARCVSPAPTASTAIELHAFSPFESSRDAGGRVRV